MTTITIIGAGMMGTALCWPLRDNGIDVRLVGTPLDEEIIRSITESRLHPTLERRIPDGVQAFFCEDLARAMAGADAIANGVSSFGTDWFARTAGPLLKPGVPVISVTKGLVLKPDGYLQSLPEHIDESLPAGLQGKVSLNAIGGPCIAHELAARRHTCVVFAGLDGPVLRRLSTIFSTPYYHIWLSTALREVEVCAALKNGYALAIGMAVGIAEKLGPDGLAKMYNPQAALFAQSCQEMRLLLKSQGGNDLCVDWLPGAGDLYVTVFGGRTRELGRLLGLGFSFSDALEQMAGVTLESIETVSQVAAAIPPLEARGLIRAGDLPLMQAVYRVIHDDKPVDMPWSQFFWNNRQCEDGPYA
jgi:glycerol-3-phosphate dehydrogenase (NAD(P)+)